MKLTDKVADRVCNFVFGVAGVALGVASLPAATASMAALPVVIGAGTIMGFALAAKQRHAVDDKATLDRLRNGLAAEWLSDQSFGWSERAEIEAACDLLDRHLEQCMLSPKELAAAASGLDGRRFPEAATELVISALTQQCIEFSKSPTKDFAIAVITRAFEIAVEDEAYFKKFEPHLLIETARVSGKTLGVVEELKSSVHGLPDAIASAIASELRTMEARVLKAFAADRAGDADPVSAEEFRVAVGKLLRSGNARKQYAIKLAADGDVAGAAVVLTELANVQEASLADAITQTIDTLTELGALSLFSNPATAVSAYERAYSLNTGNLEVLERVGTAMMHAGRLPEAKEVLSRVDGSSADPLLRLQARYHLAQVSLQESDFPAAFVLFENALADARSQKSDFFTALCLNNLSAMAVVRRDPAAKKLLTEAIEISAKTGHERLALPSALNLAQILIDDGEAEEAVEVLLKLEPSLGDGDPREQFAIIIGRAGLETARQNNVALTISAFEASERNYRAVGSKEAGRVRKLLQRVASFPQSKKPQR